MQVPGPVPRGSGCGCGAWPGNLYLCVLQGTLVRWVGDHTSAALRAPFWPPHPETAHHRGAATGPPLGPASEGSRRLENGP